MTFQIHPLPMADFKPLFVLSDEELQSIGARRVICDAQIGYPCRVSLQDADIGDELVLVNYPHLTGNTPYASSHALYVRKSATEVHPDVGQIPVVLSSRLLSVRAFNAEDLMVCADVVDGTNLANQLTQMFANPAVRYIHIHNAKQGCYAAKAMRAQ